VADEVLAQREAERAQKRALEAGDESPPPASPKRRRSYSPGSDSVSTISTRSPSPARERSHQRRATRSRSPARQRPAERHTSRSPRRRQPRAHRDVSPPPVPRRQRSPSRERYSYGSSESPKRSFSGGAARDQQFPSPRPGRRNSISDRDNDRTNRTRREPSRSRSRSPVRLPDRPQGRPGRYRDREVVSNREDTRAARNPPQQRRPSPPRERSLSPFSKRLALTQSMNSGR